MDTGTFTRPKKSRERLSQLGSFEKENEPDSQRNVADIETVAKMQEESKYPPQGVEAE